MINFIVGSALIFAIGFSLVWILNKNFRKKIEAPKYDFLDKVSAFEHGSNIKNEENHGVQHEH